MASLLGRSDRRRRVLNEEVLSASSSHTVYRAAQAEEDTAAGAPRYSDAAGVENHPQVTDFVPRRYGSLALLGLAGAGSVAALAALDYFARPIAAVLGLATTVPLELAAPGSLGSWLAAVTMLLISVACLLVYSIRRHRIDDFRGRYRVWLGAAAGCLLMSVDSVTALHATFSEIAGAQTGWSALRGGAVWWLVVAGLPLGWIAVRALFDVRECRLSAALLSAGGACYALALAGYLGLLPGEPRVVALAAAAAALLGHCLVLVSVTAYARFVVLDAQGLVQVRRRKKPAEPGARAARRGNSTRANKSTDEEPSGRERAVRRQAAAKVTSAESDETEWIDGSHPEADDYDDDVGDSRKLSKADRKRLRKLKAQQRAA